MELSMDLRSFLNILTFSGNSKVMMKWEADRTSRLPEKGGYRNGI